jgi:uncharacterized sporulation protein YeaH/YhbH (DUF444 family)
MIEKVGEKSSKLTERGCGRMRKRIELSTAQHSTAQHNIYAFLKDDGDSAREMSKVNMKHWLESVIKWQMEFAVL